jgi:hypothetical protein
MNDRTESPGEHAVHSLAARHGRRALMLGAAAASAGLAAELVTGGSAEAAPDASKPVLLGKQNITSGATSVGSTNSNGLEGHTHTTNKAGVAGLDFNPKHGSHGVYGQTNHGNGVFGIALGAGDGDGAHSTLRAPTLSTLSIPRRAAAPPCSGSLRTAWPCTPRARSR